MIDVKRTAPSGTIILNRLETRNAISPDFIERFSECLSDFHQQKDVRCVIVTHAGPVFCSGIDLKIWQENSASQNPEALWFDQTSQLKSLIEQMLQFPKPIVVALDGPVIGGGMAIALAADLVVASPKASFELPGPKRGLVNGLVAPLLQFRFGASLCSRMMLGHETIDCEVAKQFGMIHRCVESDQVWAAAHAWAYELSESAPQAMQLSKRLINEMLGESLMTDLSSAAAVTASACTTDAAIEGLQAFVEKREPKFQ